MTSPGTEPAYEPVGARDGRRLGKPIRLTAALLAFTSLAVVPCAKSQTVPGQVVGRISLASDSTMVSLLTIGPGGQLFDRFGHTAIRIRNPRTGLDSAWNWGMYDFAAPNFITRFLTGDTQYWMAGYPTEWTVLSYQRAGRAIWEQDLALDRAQADSLLTLLRWNARDENKFYRYDYYLDNCSTRVRDVLDAITGGALRPVLTSAATGVTWRGETLRLVDEFPLAAFGMTVALGRPAERTLTVWDETFIPMRLRDALRSVRMARPGGSVPLVSGERVLAPVGAYPEAAQPPQYAGIAGLIGMLAALAIAALGRRASTSTPARLAVQITGSVWHLIVGIAGTLVLLAGLFTRHDFMAVNETVLLGTPASLALVALYARGWTQGAQGRAAHASVMLAVFAAFAAIVALGAHLIGTTSANGVAPALLIVPVHVALALSLVAHRRESERPAGT